MSNTPDVVVLHRWTHGIDPDAYTAALRERLPDHAVCRARTPAQERELIPRAPVATGVEFDTSLFEHADALELFCAGSAGVGHLPVAEFADRGVILTNASGVNSPNVAEYVLGGMLSVVRQFHVARDRKHDREWRQFEVDELRGSTVTVVGLGAIGTDVVERLGPFDVETLGVRYTPSKGGPTDEVFGFDDDSFHEALARTDFLVLACPLTETTRGLVDAGALDTLGPDAVVVNVARGPILDTDALATRLQEDELGGAVLDVTDPEPLPEDHSLWSLANVLLTPHSAGHSPRYAERLADLVAPNVDRYLAGEEDRLTNVVGPDEVG